MSPRRNRSQTRASKRWYANPPSACLAMVPVDASETRAKERAGYDEALKDLGRQSRRAQAFRENDLPSFQSWVERELADERKRLEPTVNTFNELKRLVAEVQSYVCLTQVSSRDAYRTLLEAKARGEEEALWREAEAALDREDAEERQKAQPEADSDGLGDDDGGRPSNPFGPSKSSERYLRSIYRQLVRRLHPDITGVSSGTNRLLWQEVQEAYKIGDLHALEKLLKTLNGEQPDFDLGEIPIGDIVELRRDVERRLFMLELQIRDYRASPAWNFSSKLGKPHHLEKLKVRITKQMESDARELEQQILTYEELIAAWQQEPRAKRKRKG